MAALVQVMKGVREYAEEEPVWLGEEAGRICVIASNQAGHDRTEVDLLDLIQWLKEHRPELF